MTARTTSAPTCRPGGARRGSGRRARSLLTLAVALTTLAGCASGGGSGPATSGPATSSAATAVSSAPSSGGSVSGSSASASASGPAASVASSPTADVALSFTVAGGKATPGFQQVDVAKGQTVSITVTSDTADELHVHGYDNELELPAGTPATVTFVADQTGQFEVETHESGLRLASLVVR